MADDLFAPPSQDEIDLIESDPMFTPPTEEELAGPSLIERGISSVGESASSLVDDYLRPIGEGIVDTARGAAQGATLGFSDELEGLGSAAIQKLAGSDDDFSNLYRAAQKGAEKRVKESQERSPWLSGAGDIGGTILAGILSGGAGLAAAGSRAAGSTALKAGGKEAAKYLGKLAATGAGTGAIAAAGRSEGDLSAEGQQILQDDIVSGATAGAVLSPLMGYMGGKVGQKMSQLDAEDALKEKPLLRQIIRSYRLGKAGKDVGRGDASRKTVSSIEKRHLNAITNKFVQPLEQMSNEFDELLAQGFQSGAIDRKAFEKLARNFGKEYTDDLAELAQRVPGLNELNKQMSMYQKDVLSRLISNVEGDVNFAKINPEKQVNRIRKNIRQLLRELNLPGHSDTGSIQRETLYDLNNNLKGLENKIPGFLKKYGFSEGTGKDALKNLRGFERDISKRADDFAVFRQALGDEPQAGPLTNLLSSIGLTGATTGRGMVVGLGNVAGAARNKVGQTLNKLGPQQLRSVGQSLTDVDDPTAQKFGKMLIDGLDSGDVYKKNAALYVILQNPSLRSIVTGEEEE